MDWDLARKLARSERCQFLVEALDLEAATDIPGAQWEPFQLSLLNDDTLLRHDRKSRQIGYSWCIAAESVAVATLYPRSTCLFVSINREEAAEKIRYAKQCHDALFPPFRATLVQDNVNALIYSNGSRIISMPQRPIRGRPKAWLYLDEFAHYRLDRAIYTAGVPVTTKGGRLRVGSTTLGARGMFWEIGEQRIRSYPGYVRGVTPWWRVGSLLKPQYRERLREVDRACFAMGEDRDRVEERVRRYGNERLQDIFDNLPLDDWLQEYECVYVDETMAYIAWADIMACCNSDADNSPYALQWVAHTPEQALACIDDMAHALARGKALLGPLTWGLDIGRKKDLTELAICELVAGVVVQRALFSLDRQSFETQAMIVKSVLDRLPVLRGYIDQNGLGMQLAETFHLDQGYGERAMPMVFSQPSKAIMAVHLKTRFQRGAMRGPHGIVIIDDRDLKYQIHSIRRRVTANGNVVFDVEASERHHADKFWALALAVEAAETFERIEAYPVSENAILRTTQKLDSLMPTANAPDLGDQWGVGLSLDQYNTLVEQGIHAVIGQIASRVALPPAGVAAVERSLAPVPDQATIEVEEALHATSETTRR